ncbi:tripartite tricarboxylate transporter substrate binding protein [Elioraea tepidiphila]|jgi:tripartite-type tricarboxylate transporter receptor subunit TctC|uniref:Bug family tripartite tricarboxylate transporter substrate binding protein n=1 Tax=Elioraea tepidiphila TaxID=457934 RepID=UPI000377E3D2|nr:tripartite tricarboxylate transporter substrate binding protein [Elioraea tepidiphila]
MHRRILLAAIPTFTLARPTLAQSWPSRPVRIIVPFAAGGPADIYARQLGERLGPQLGQPFVVENRPGAGAVIGTEAAKSATDGHTLLMMSNTHTANETLLPNRPYVLLRDFVPVAPVNIANHALIARPDLDVASLADLIAMAKARPGTLNYASSGPGTPYHIAGAKFCHMAQIQVEHIPFRGSGEARSAIMGSTVDWMFDSITTQIQNVQTGRVKGLATSGERRSPLLPELPTVAEAGVAGYTSSIWLGIVAPGGTPDAVVQRLNEAITRIATAEDTRAAWARQAVDPMPMSAAEFRAYIERDIQDQAEVIRAANIRVG